MDFLLLLNVSKHKQSDLQRFYFLRSITSFRLIIKIEFCDNLSEVGIEIWRIGPVHFQTSKSPYIQVLSL